MDKEIPSTNGFVKMDGVEMTDAFQDTFCKFGSIPITLSLQHKAHK